MVWDDAQEEESEEIPDEGTEEIPEEETVPVEIGLDFDADVRAGLLWINK